MIYLTMNDGRQIPQLGFGCYGVPCNEEGKKAILEAIKIGYRHFDTAHVYENEKIVGEAIAESGLPREEFFITSKLWPTEFGYKKSKKALDEMLKRIRLDYLDMVLLHKETFDYKGAWKALEEYQEKGLVKSLGVSNFETKKKIDTLSASKTVPAVNQLEAHPYRQQRELDAYGKVKGIITQSWSPLGHGLKELLCDPVIKQIADDHNKTIAQIILRWHIQMGYIVIPMTMNYEHMRQNFEIFDFELNSTEMEIIAEMDGKKQLDTLPKFLWSTAHWFQGFSLKGIDKAQK